MKTFELRSIKTAGGEETPRFEAKIFYDGREVAHVHNDGNGGCCFDRWNDKRAERAFYEWVIPAYRARTERTPVDTNPYNMVTDEKTGKKVSLDVWHKQHVKDSTDKQLTSSALDSWLFWNLDNHDERAKLRRKMKKSTLFRTEDMAPGDWRQLSVPTGDPRVKAWLEKNKLSHATVFDGELPASSY